MRRPTARTAGTPVKVGMIGCGAVSAAYLAGAQVFPEFDVVACADRVQARAEAAAAAARARVAPSVAELLADPEVELVLNLTAPADHAPVALQALAAGKPVYGEKPLAVTRRQAAAILELAAARGLRVGSAPDTFLGASLQTGRRLIDAGAIGEPLGAAAFLMCRGHEAWHPDPDFYYRPGGGPMLDMGPYYVTALVTLLGPVRSVTGLQRASFPERVIGSGPRAGEVIPVRTPTYVAGVCEFATGAIGTIVTTFDVWAASLPFIEIYGSEGSLGLPDPNHFLGPVRLWRPGRTEWRETPIAFDQGPRNRRGLGLADMAAALRAGRPHRAAGELAYHVLDVLLAFSEAAESGRRTPVRSRCTRPEPTPGSSDPPAATSG
jgi:predicted dehydrogenase